MIEPGDQFFFKNFRENMSVGTGLETRRQAGGGFDRAGSETGVAQGPFSPKFLKKN